MPEKPELVKATQDLEAEQAQTNLDKTIPDLGNYEENVDSDLDISTQEMSEILDRNSCTEVISPLHLQRNKSQSISSIGSFCSVSSNISFQEKSKRSGSQVSLGSLNNSEKTAHAVVGALTDQVVLRIMTMNLSEPNRIVHNVENYVEKNQFIVIVGSGQTFFQ